MPPWRFGGRPGSRYAGAAFHTNLPLSSVFPWSGGLAMDKGAEALTARLVGTTRSVRDLWLYVAIAASLISLFGSSAAQLKLFRVLVGLYRTLTTIAYDVLEWPGRLNLQVLLDHPAYEQQIRDISTVIITVTGILIVKLAAEIKTYRTIRAALADNEKAALEAISRARAQAQDDDSGPGAALAGGTLFGLILAGPIGALFGALAGGLFGLAASQEVPPEVPDPATVHSAVENELVAARTEARRRLLDRVGFSLLVGTLVIVLDWNAAGLITRLTEIDKVADRIVNGWVAAVAAHPKGQEGTASVGPRVPSAPGTPPVEASPETRSTPTAVAARRPAPASRKPPATQSAEPGAASPRLAPVLPVPAPLASPERPSARYVTRPIWRRQPSKEDGQGLYPDAARRQSETGKVVLDCTVNERGKLADCAVTSEDPAGVGFGLATLRLATMYRMGPVDRDGAPTAGAHYVLAVTWKPPAKRA